MIEKSPAGPHTLHQYVSRSDSQDAVKLTRREFVKLLTLASAATVMSGCAPALTSTQAAPAAAPSITPVSAAGNAAMLPPPETITLRLNVAPCDAPLMAAERYLRDEGFTDVQFLDAGGSPMPLTEGKADLGPVFASLLVAAVEAGKPVIGLAGIHPGCMEIWAPQSVAALKDLRGHTVVVRGKSADNLAYAFIAMALKQAGIDPSEVNFVVQPDADLAALFLDGKSDAHLAATTSAIAFHSNPANKGHVVLDQAMDAPWSQMDCCILSARTDWLRANPIAAKRAIRAILRAADAQSADRAEAVKLATDRGLFGGAKNYELVRGAANMVPLDWRVLDAAKSVQFHAQLLSDIDLLKITADEVTSNGTDLRILRELRQELRR